MEQKIKPFPSFLVSPMGSRIHGSLTCTLVFYFYFLKEAKPLKTYYNLKYSW
jgi:hypothetical protein